MARGEATAGSGDVLDEHRGVLVWLLARISAYYIVVGAVAWGLFQLFPGFLELMPVGGVVDYRPDPLIGPAEPVTRTPVDGAPLAWLEEAVSLAIAMGITLIAMLPVSWLYKAIHEGHDFDHSIDETSLLMPAVVAGVVTVAQHSLALAFSLAGIVAGVRFRRALSDTFDTLFIFVAIGVGLAAGVGAIEIALVITVFFNYATAVVCIFGDGLESKYIAAKELRSIERRNGSAGKKKKKKKKKDNVEASVMTGSSSIAASVSPTTPYPGVRTENARSYAPGHDRQAGVANPSSEQRDS
ncbi:MAG: DUF4956 domain-containing protein [Alphaproteobacteria bacterium]|nr:DUF4956 domain-containing protein [Alphaproteobacteria bacterium]